jgi:hypothetical protein
MALTAEQTARLQEINRAVLSGTATKELCKEGLQILAQDRVSASIAGAASKAKAAESRKVIDPTALIADLRAKAAAVAGTPIPGAPK